MQPTSSFPRKPVRHPRKATKQRGRAWGTAKPQPQPIFHPIFGVLWLFAK